MYNGKTPNFSSKKHFYSYFQNLQLPQSAVIQLPLLTVSMKNSIILLLCIFETSVYACHLFASILLDAVKGENDVAKKICVFQV